MKLRPITTDADHQSALHEIERLMDVEDDGPKAAMLDALATLVQAYEAKRYPIAPLPPVDVIKAHMETNDYRHADLARVLGSRSRATEILSRTRPLTLDMIRRLQKAWGIPADILVQPYRLAKDASTRKRAA